jgi:DNA-binding transcriptional regulator YiaG
LQDVSTNPDAYQQKLLLWNSAADPRFFQEMSKDEAQKAFAAMSPTEIKALREKKALAKQLGILP